MSFFPPIFLGMVTIPPIKIKNDDFEDGLWHCFTHITQKPLPMTIYDLHSKISKNLPPIMAKEGCARSRSLIKPGTSENHSWEIHVDMGHG